MMSVTDGEKMRRNDAARYIDRHPESVRKLFKAGVLEGEHDEEGVLWISKKSLDDFLANPVRRGRPRDTVATPARSKAKQELREYNRIKQRESRARREREARSASRRKSGKRGPKAGRKKR